MPFDGKDYKPKIKPLQTGLAGLKQIRDVALWNIPPYFRWAFERVLEKNDCGSAGCLLGLARTVWPEQIRGAFPNAITDFLRLPHGDLNTICGLGGDDDPYHGKLNCEVTPHDVADAIDRYIAEKEAEGRAA